MHHILVFLGGYGANEISHADDINEESATLSPIQSICRVTVPIVALQDQFLPYRRSIFTTALTGRLYNTLSEEIDREACWAMYAEVMVWALMFGIYIAHGHSPEKEVWFTKELVNGVRGRKGQSGQLGGGWQWGWKTVKPLLKRFYWCEIFFGEEFKGICELLIPAIHAPSHTTPRAMDALIMVACRASKSQASLDDQYGELIGCLKTRARS